MTWLLYLSNVIFARCESALGKYSVKKCGDSISFNRSKTISAALLSLLFALIAGFDFHGETLLFALLYGGSLALSTHAGVKALSLGSMAIASMLASFSLVIPCLWGLIFLDERISLVGGIGLVLLALSILLLNFKKSSGSISPKCWFYSILTMLSNGIGSVIQKQHQTSYPGEYQTEFMLFSMAFASVIFIAIGFLKTAKSEKTEKSNAASLALILGLIAGVCNCFANFIILFLATLENASVLFPILSAANAVGACLVGRIVFKERLSALQFISILLGITSVVLLKI